MEDRFRSEMRFWKGTGIILAVLTGAGAVAGVVGKAFYVTREEYTEKVRTDSVSETSIKSTLEQLNETIRQQRTSFDRLSGSVEEVKTNIIVIKAQTSRRNK